MQNLHYFETGDKLGDVRGALFPVGPIGVVSELGEIFCSK